MDLPAVISPAVSLFLVVVYCIIYLQDDQDSDGVDVSVSCLCKLSLWSTWSIHPAKRTETHEEHLTANAMKEKGSRGEDKNK
jgi:hypothetical protein